METQEKMVNGRFYIRWACPYTLQNGKECGREHWVEWDKKFDSPCDGASLYCPKHKGKEN